MLKMQIRVRFTLWSLPTSDQTIATAAAFVAAIAAAAAFAATAAAAAFVAAFAAAAAMDQTCLMQHVFALCTLQCFCAMLRMQISLWSLPTSDQTIAATAAASTAAAIAAAFAIDQTC